MHRSLVLSFAGVPLAGTCGLDLFTQLFPQDPLAETSSAPYTSPSPISWPHSFFLVLVPPQLSRTSSLGIASPKSVSLAFHLSASHPVPVQSALPLELSRLLTGAALHLSSWEAAVVSCRLRVCSPAQAALPRLSAPEERLNHVQFLALPQLLTGETHHSSELSSSPHQHDWLGIAGCHGRTAHSSIPAPTLAATRNSHKPQLSPNRGLRHTCCCRPRGGCWPNLKDALEPCP